VLAERDARAPVTLLIVDGVVSFIILSDRWPNFPPSPQAWIWVAEPHQRFLAVQLLPLELAAFRAAWSGC
jgi:hypothetical protein